MDNDADNLENNGFLNSVLQYKDKHTFNSHLIRFFKPDFYQKFSLHYCSVSYAADKQDSNNFIKYCSSLLTDKNCTEIMNATRDQSKSMLWHELRYARITASKLYEASQCKTFHGSLLESIMGGKVFSTYAMQRGSTLEHLVLDKIQKFLGKPVTKVGLTLNAKYPMLGASPDGETDDAVIEIKCPNSDKAVTRYYDKGMIQTKYKAQMQLQMFFAKKHVGYFCIANPEFEKNGKVMIIKDTYSEKFLTPIIKRAVKFWETAVFPILMKNNH